MILDGFLRFTGGSGGIGNNDGATDSPTTGTQDSSNVLDLGIGANATSGGLPLSGSGGGARDIGIGDDPAMKLLLLVTTAFGGGTNMAVQIAGAPDGGSGTAGSFTVMAVGPTVVEANLIAGARLFDIDVPRPAPTQALPRFLKLQFVSSGTHSSGKVQGQIVLDRHDLPEQSNAVLGGYPAGITVAN